MKTYLGDSVYADFDGYNVVLTTENGYGPSNTIYMEPQVLDALAGYVKRITNLKQGPTVVRDALGEVIFETEDGK